MESKTQDWLTLFNQGSPIDRVVARGLLRQQGSEFAKREVYEAAALALATNDSAVVLVGNTSGATTKIRVADSDSLVIEELDYFYEEAAGGTVTSAIKATTLELKVDGRPVAQLPKFALSAYAVGSEKLRFGPLKLGIVIPRGKVFSLTATPNGDVAADEMNLFVSLLVRREPRDIMEAAALVEASRRA